MRQLCNLDDCRGFSPGVHGASDQSSRRPPSMGFPWPGTCSSSRDTWPGWFMLRKIFCCYLEIDPVEFFVLDFMQEGGWGAVKYAQACGRSFGILMSSAINEKRLLFFFTWSPAQDSSSFTAS